MLLGIGHASEVLELSVPDTFWSVLVELDISRQASAGKRRQSRLQFLQRVCRNSNWRRLGAYWSPS